MSGYTVTLTAEIDYETLLDVHLYFDNKRLAEFVLDESCDWGQFRRNIFLNMIVNRVWIDPNTKFESPSTKEYTEIRVINGNWSGYEPASIEKTPPLYDSSVFITGELNNYTVHMYTVLNTDECNILESDILEN